MHINKLYEIKNESSMVLEPGTIFMPSIIGFTGGLFKTDIPIPYFVRNSSLPAAAETGNKQEQRNSKVEFIGSGAGIPFH